ncbi:MAG: hypothetical protein EPN93_08485 [Spirochaetes bacterium]|nr:MAG: hypothetical protein EPN93_08485 [Spirochaetota bacterium]
MKGFLDFVLDAGKKEKVDMIAEFKKAVEKRNVKVLQEWFSANGYNAILDHECELIIAHADDLPTFKANITSDSY